VEAKPNVLKKSYLEQYTAEGDSPVFENTMAGSDRVGRPGLGV
jgi:hypothetical protein